MREPSDSKPHQNRPFVPEGVEMKEFTLRAVLLGLVMTVILGAANAYLGLRAGMTIAATYPAAVIGMAVLRMWKGTVLEENLARTAGSIGESVAAGAVFTLPAFLIAGLVDVVRSFTRLLEIDGAHDGGRHPRRAVRIAGAEEFGGRSRPAVSGIGSRVGDPQGRPARRGIRALFVSGTSDWAC